MKLPFPATAPSGQNRCWEFMRSGSCTPTNCRFAHDRQKCGKAHQGGSCPPKGPGQRRFNMQLQDVQFVQTALQFVQTALGRPASLEISFQSSNGNYNIRPIILSLKAGKGDNDMCPTASLYRLLQLHGTRPGPLFRTGFLCIFLCACFNRTLV